MSDFTLIHSRAPAAARVRRGGWSWGPVDNAKLRVLSLGAGVQSTTLALMAAHGEIGPMPDFAIFADTGAEPELVYEHVRWLSSGNVLPFPIITVSAGNIRDDLKSILAGRPVKSGGRAASAPFYTYGRDGQAAPLRRQCTSAYKIEPINAELRRLLGYRPRQRIPTASVEVWIGISLDEVVRAAPAFENWIVNRHPLLEGDAMSRWDCEQWLRRHCYDVPLKSACTFCPYRTNAELARLRDTSPSDFADAVAIDAAIRPGIVRNAKGTMTGNLFIHRSLKPLDQVDLRTDEEAGQGMLMLCDAGCGL